MKTKFLPFMALAGSMSIVLISQSVRADENTGLSPEIVVTASRIAKTIDDTLAPVTIITREDIEKQQPLDIQDLLRNVPGLGLINNGGLGKSTSISLRGTEATHVLVLIDGVRVGSATKGTTSFQHIPVSQIERIEVVRGARSHLYGSGAVGGVIQIFTRRGKGEGVKNYGSVGYGSHKTIDASGGFSGTAEGTRFSMNIGKQGTEGFNSKVSDSEDDKDGYSRKSLSGSVSREFENGLELELHGSAVSSATEYDGTTVNETDAIQRSFAFNANKDVLDIWNANLSASKSWDLTDNFKSGTYKSTFDTIRDNVTLQNNFYINDENTVIVGLDYLLDRIESSSTYAENRRFNNAAFGQYILEFGNHNFQTSMRFDENEQFGESKTGSVAYGYSILSNLDVFGSYATAFKAPTFNQLYSSAGNSTLQPEDTKSYEIGLRGRHDNSNWAIYAFQTDIDNLISYNSGTSKYENVDKAKLKGVEVEGSIHLGDWNVASNISYVNPENRSAGANYGNTLRRRAKWRGNLNVDYSWDAYNFGANFNYVGNSYDNTSNTNKLKRYNTVDLRGSYNFKPDWSIALSANNVFNRDYQTIRNYAQDGRNFFIRLHYTPE